MIPPDRDASFVAGMEAILDLYQAPPDPARPLICFDEGGTALQADSRTPWPSVPGRATRQDYEYIRRGSVNVFVSCAPHLGWRDVQVTERRTAVDWAQAMQRLVNQFPDAEQLIVVMDNLNTHRLASLYTAFPAAEARRIARKLDLRLTPLHGSWLNIAELELNALSHQCLARRLPDRETVTQDVAAWAQHRNAAGIRVNWRFGVADARTKMHRTYPVPVCDR
ncbi:MAG TPA: IS630 family transposase [Thermomicrobiales bacterium]|nr:IS630 family transposase [Thermomicrobiales bacterium]